MNLSDTIARLAAVTETHGDALLAKGDEPGAARMFSVSERADDLAKELLDPPTAALVEELMQGVLA